MGNIFAGSEIVEIGIQIEKNGQDFYNTLVARTKSDRARELYLYLAGEEGKHILAFQKMLDKTDKYDPPEVYAQEYLEYMNSLASEYVFTQKDKGTAIAQGTKSDQEALELGIKFEKDSILFYEGMKKVVPDYDQKIIGELIRQEQEHLRKLVGLKNNL